MRRLEAISARGDPLEIIKTSVPWKDIRADVARETKPEERISNAVLMILARTMRIARTLLPPIKFGWWPNTSARLARIGWRLPGGPHLRRGLVSNSAHNRSSPCLSPRLYVSGALRFV